MGLIRAKMSAVGVMNEAGSVVAGRSTGMSQSPGAHGEAEKPMGAPEACYLRIRC